PAPAPPSPRRTGGSQPCCRSAPWTSTSSAMLPQLGRKRVMSVSGSLKTMSVEDVLDWLDRRELRGELVVDQLRAQKRLRVAYGCVTGASSDNPVEYLGQILINHGLLDEERLRHAYAEMSGEAVSLGKMLLRLGYVEEAALREALVLKIRESVFDA